LHRRLKVTPHLAANGGLELDLKHVQAAIEIVDQATHDLENLERTVKLIAASEAFRRFNWLKGVPIKNVNGNFRGIVLNASWRAIFQMSADAGELLSKVSLVTGLAANLAESRQEIAQVLRSTGSWSEKGSKLSLQASSAMIRAAAGSVPAAVHVGATSILGYCATASLMSGRSVGQGSCDTTVRGIDNYVHSTFDKYTSADEMYLLISTYVTPRLSTLLGF
jgi:hypothetical protein